MTDLLAQMDGAEEGKGGTHAALVAGSHRALKVGAGAGVGAAGAATVFQGGSEALQM